MASAVPVKATVPVMGAPVSFTNPLSRDTVYDTSEAPSCPSIGAPIDMVKSVASLSIIVPMARLLALTTPTVGSEIVTITVSRDSNMLSSIIAT